MNPPAFSKAFLAPKYWPAWLLIGLFWLMARLPWAVQRRLGAGLGWLSWQLLGQRRDDTLVNLALCFPELDDDAREQMGRDTFRHAGIGIFETANAWFRSPEYYRDRISFEGLEHLRAAEARGKGILLLGAHYSLLDLGAAMASLHFKVDTVYRPQPNPVFEFVMTRRRLRYHHWTIPYRDMRLLIKALKAGHTVWYTPDQDFGRKHSVFAPFFGVSAATITTPPRLAQVNDATVLLIHFCRDKNEERYRFLITPPLDNYPTGDDITDAARINKELETLIRRSPAQYMWSHRRFKTQPVGQLPPYPPKRHAAERRQRRRAARAAARAAGKKS
ncbi:MAG TPA: LpxL/LpxP family Kdo(2)-lipid IV(A) lauroyl/palmitoleoyl acyltransferase [Candidatus Kapabacteria bacterium]|nr:LpxL/LpxP family Kdo(2)-lipid IV(A) lauroyl/palmitoleoyl acyltransferase [Candidatus Kapabacteria bacterium]